MSELSKKAIKGTFWSLAEAIGARLVQFIIGIILARLLLPEQFGLIGMLMIFIAVSQALLRSGLGSAVIQKSEVTKVDTSSVFYYNVVVSIVMAGLLCLAAPWIAAFYKQPVLTSLVRAMSLVIVVNSFVVIQTALLTRNVDFKTQTKVSLIAGTCSGAIGITMAWLGSGVWSLVAQQVSEALVRAAMLWLLSGWRPGLIFSFRSLREMFGFGSRMLASSVLDQVFTNIYFVVIGRLYSPAALGFYTRARRLVDLPSMTLSNVITRVSFPVFSVVQADDERMKNGLRRALMMVVFVNFPAMLGLAVVARPLVQVLLTERWLPSVPYIRLLCIVGLLLPFQTLNLSVLMAKGRSDLFLRLEFVKKALVVLTIALVWRWGIAALIWGQIATSCLAYFLNSYYVGKFLNYSALKQMRDVGIYLLFSAVMGAGVYLVGILGFPNDLVRLIAQIGTGLVLYTSLCGLFRLPAFITGWDEMRSRLPCVDRWIAQFKRISKSRRSKVK